jgi:uncharacterized protein YkwD
MPVQVMIRRLVVAMLALGLTSACSAALAQDEGQGLLDAHNAYREKHCVPALTWSPEIAATAQKWADACSMSHDSNSGYGENLAWGTGLSAGAAVDMWYGEASKYDFASPGYKSGIGHFTQMIWKSSTQLGCGVATCGDQTFRVCRYSPPGNYEGEFPANVQPACK